MGVLGARRDKLSQRDAGFTLVELVVAMLVIAIVLIAIITVQARALTTNAVSQARQESTAIANQAMEELRSMPWDYLKKGLYSGFNAGGGDPFVTGSTLTVKGLSYPLTIGSTGSDQDLGDPWPPLFDGAGSNVQTVSSPSGNGDTFTVRTYVTGDQADPEGNLNSVGLVVVVSWDKRSDGDTVETVLTSTAYAPSAASTGCGDTQQAPYLAACQAQFEATASTARIDVSATATSLDGLNTDMPLLNGTSIYRMQMPTGSSAARVASQQVSVATSVATLGGTLWDDNLDSTSPSDIGWTRGSTQFQNEASDDATTGAAPPNPDPVTGPGTISTYSFGSHPFTFYVRSDDERIPTAGAKTTESCTTGLGVDIVAGAPCASGSVTNAGNPARMELTDVDGKMLSFANVSTSGLLSDWAWAARFANIASPSSLVGCDTVISGTSGCTSAGAQKKIGSVVLGGVTGANWSDVDDGDYLFHMTNYSDSVFVQRGVAVPAAAPEWNRGASISYFNESGGYSSFTLGTSDESQMKIGPATWSTALATVTATGTIDVTGTYSHVLSTADCKGTEGCSVSAGNGWVQVDISYEIAPIAPASFTPWTMTVKTIINGSQASALFKESPNA